MTNEEAKIHFQKLAQDSGLSKEQTDAVLQAMDNEKFRGSVTQGYKRHDEYSRGMDELRGERQKLMDWYQREELPKYNAYQQGLADLRRYQEIYGSLDDQGLNNGDGYQQQPARPGLTRDELERHLDEKLRARDAAFVNLTKDAMRASSDFTRRFGEVLDPDEVERLALQRGITFAQAYKEYVAPREQAALEAKHKTDIEQAKAEAVRDFQSRMNIPVDTRPREAHPFFDRKSPDSKLTELDADRHSREAFIQGWNNYEAELKPRS